MTLSGKVSFLFVAVFQCFIAVLDIVGVLLILIIVSNYQDHVSSKSLGFLPEEIQKYLEDSTKIGVILGVVILIFSIKSIFGFVLNSIFIRTAGKETNRLVRILGSNLLGGNPKAKDSLTSQEISFLMFEATQIIFMETLSPMIILVSDVFLISVIFLNISFNAAVIFLPSILYFLFIFVLLRFVNSHYTKGVYKRQVDAEIESKTLIQETFFAYKELITSNNLNSFITKISKSRKIGVESAENISIARLVPKYVYEFALFGGIGLIAVVSTVLASGESVALLITLFLVSASRMIPSFLRIQYYLGVLQKSAAQSDLIFTLFSKITVNQNYFDLPEDGYLDSKLESNEAFEARIIVENVSFSYLEDSKSPSLDDVSLRIDPFTSTAVVGESGAGKSTLINLILGFNDPLHGRVEISGKPPLEAFKVWPGKVGYVPQRITILNSTLAENIAIGEPISQIDYPKVERLLSAVGLGDYSANLNGNFKMHMGEFGSKLSGGQIQKIGIARALYFDPSLLVLDEATSALDMNGENAILNLLLNEMQITILMITHRVSTIKNVDKIVYVEEGGIAAVGTFSEIAAKVPNFENHVAKLVAKKS
jgi:ABC-type multidrug transport system fused ATPase/permease subunit